jgi:hypothetical protein
MKKSQRYVVDVKVLLVATLAVVAVPVLWASGYPMRLNA